MTDSVKLELFFSEMHTAKSERQDIKNDVNALKP